VHNLARSSGKLVLKKSLAVLSRFAPKNNHLTKVGDGRQVLARISLPALDRFATFPQCARIPKSEDPAKSFLLAMAEIPNAAARLGGI
jgi:hypothetical protein